MMLPQILPPSRRQFLQSAACGFGSLAFSALCAEQAAGSPLAPKAPHFTPRARRVIFLFMQGGPSHMDMFDYKPRLDKENGQKLPFALPETESTVGLDGTLLMGPVTKFKQQGQSGLLMTEALPHLGKLADELCVLRAVQADSPNHPTAITFLHTGTITDIRPAMGSWITYGLGTENQNLPGYVTILPGEGERNYSSAFLPAIYQGTAIQEVSAKAAQPPIRNLADTTLSAHRQRQRIDLTQAMNRNLLQRLETDQQMEGVIESFELAFRMQRETPRLMDLSQEKKETLDLYGIGQAPTDKFGRQCLLARRMAEAGVRFIQVTLGGWDHHGTIRELLPKSCAEADKPIAGLLTDLKSRGLLNDTLVIWSGEFGRTPFFQDLSFKRSFATAGREHNPKGFTVWLAGGGVKAGMTYGQTDEYGYRAIDGKVHMHDLHATILHLLGLDHEKLTYRHAGRDYRLTDVHGHVVKPILA